MNSYPSLEGVCVLVVDDEADSRQVVATVLARRGACITQAASVREALAALEQHTFHVLVADIAMPHEDGYKLIDEIRLRERARGTIIRLPAAATTGYARTEDRIRLLQAGYQMHLPKPIDPDELIFVVAALADWGGQLPARLPMAPSSEGET